MGVTRLTSSANPRIKAVVRLRRQRERRKQGLFVAEGAREIERAVAAGLGVHALFFCPERVERHHGMSDPAKLGAWFSAAHDTFEVTEPLMKKLATLAEPAGMVAVIEQPHWSLANLPTVSSATLYLVAVGIEKPGNLGAMARTAAAAGCEALIVGDGVADAFNPHAIRNSTGAVFTLPTLALSRDALVSHCQANGLRLAAATLREARCYTEADMTGPLAMAVGPEDTGLDDAWHAAADATAGPRVTIPMHSATVDSLNAAASAAVLLFEARRQRR
jgi:TrmH family RNA methyltransferase